MLGEGIMGSRNVLRPPSPPFPLFLIKEIKSTRTIFLGGGERQNNGIGKKRKKN
jgi:hypothetical protein